VSNGTCQVRDVMRCTRPSPRKVQDGARMQTTSHDAHRLFLLPAAGGLSQCGPGIRLCSCTVITPTPGSWLPLALLGGRQATICPRNDGQARNRARAGGSLRRHPGRECAAASPAQVVNKNILGKSGMQPAMMQPRCWPCGTARASTISNCGVASPGAAPNKTRTRHLLQVQHSLASSDRFSQTDDARAFGGAAQPVVPVSLRRRGGGDKRGKVASIAPKAGARPMNTSHR
jgi:hypothetical protein